MLPGYRAASGCYGTKTGQSGTSGNRGKRKLELKSWRRETVSAQAVISSKIPLQDVMIETGNLVLSGRKTGETIPASSVRAGFVRYVMIDELNKDRKGGCGYRPVKAEWDSSLVADAIDVNRLMDVGACSVRPIWLKVSVPEDAAPGTYTGQLKISYYAESGEQESKVLDYTVNVSSRVLPPAHEWAFDLDLWQNPYSVARVYGVPLWSDAHFEAMYPLMKMLADLGQKSITASVMYHPWDAQTEDAYDSMVTRIKKIDGSWVYDYAVFDKWVEFMMFRVGIDARISCYTMIPWSLKFDYFDEATSRVQFVEARPGDKEYEEYWLCFLKDFAEHLKAKGWFDKTMIAMDERPMESMKSAISLIKAADPNFKVSLAGDYHDDIQADLDYLSIPYGRHFPADVLEWRMDNGKTSTVYTCCSDAFPNTFTFSAPAEATWNVIHALAAGYDGALRWAVNSWTSDPLRDSRFRAFAAGDTYSIYPGPRSSIRYERLLEGLQICAKISVLRDELKGVERARLEKAVSGFAADCLAGKNTTCEEMIANLKKLL